MESERPHDRLQHQGLSTRSKHPSSRCDACRYSITPASASIQTSVDLYVDPEPSIRHGSGNEQYRHTEYPQSPHHGLPKIEDAASPPAAPPTHHFSHPDK